MSNIFILGSEGFIGKEIVAILLKKKKKIYTLDIKQSNRQGHICGNINTFNLLDFINQSNISYLIDLIGCSNHNFSNNNLIKYSYNKNYSEKLNLISALKEIKKKINFFTIGSLYKFAQQRKIKKKYFSTINRSNDPQLVFKYMFEKKLFNISNDNLKTMVINIGSVYGNSSKKKIAINFIDQIALNIKNKKKNKIFLTKKIRFKNAIYIKDIAKKIILLIKKNKKKYTEINITDYLINFNKFAFYLKSQKKASIFSKKIKFNYYYIDNKRAVTDFENTFNRIYCL